MYFFRIWQNGIQQNVFRRKLIRRNGTESSRRSGESPTHQVGGLGAMPAPPVMSGAQPRVVVHAGPTSVQNTTLVSLRFADY